MAKFVDRTGQQHGRLHVLRVHDKDAKGNYRWLCQCDCGNELIVRGYSLASHTNSCGCLQKERTSTARSSHRLSGNSLYSTYHTMLRRCQDPEAEGFEFYGGKGISVCERWLEADGQGLSNFISDMSPRPKGATLDRKDSTKNYEPSNCRWATATTQSYNQGKRKDNSSGKVGVYWVPRLNKWTAQISKNRKRVHLGVFQTMNEAVQARVKAELELYGATRE